MDETAEPAGIPAEANSAVLVLDMKDRATVLAVGMGLHDKGGNRDLA